MAKQAKEKIAVLGGGVGAMTAVFEITESPRWQEKYDITVYQLGWRLGGKGASGRNREMHDRIEEHGLHLWFGYYENAFNSMRRCYEALGRDPSDPLSTCFGGEHPAFKSHELFIICQFWASKWSQWHLKPPVIGHEMPGDGKIPPFWEALDRLLEFLHQHYLEHLPAPIRSLMIKRPVADRVHDWLVRHGLMHGEETAGAGELQAARTAIQKIAVGETLEDAIKKELLEVVDGFGHFLENLTSALESHFAEKIENLFGIEPMVHRWLSLIDLGFYLFKGIVLDDVFEKGFDHLDKYDLRQWLEKHGAGSTTLNADALRVAYESIFAYKQGSYELPDLAAGTGLRGLLRLCFTFKGGFAWKMQAGMGDTVFGPYYQVLKERGVKFQFFSRVKDIVPAKHDKLIDSIEIGIQATVKKGPYEYDPLYDVKGLPCWPNTPNFDQLTQGETLKQRKIDLESYWVDWEDVATQTLVRGKDFDKVIMGISLGAVPVVASKLVEQNSDWKNSVKHVKTVMTQAFQIWTDYDTHRMRKPPGGEAPVMKESPVYGGFAQPHNTCADMSHLIQHEDWDPDNSPAGIYYFCGPMIEPSMMPLSTDYNFPEEELVQVKTRAAQWLRTNGQFLFPGAISRGYPGGFPDTWDFGILFQEHGPPSRQAEVFDGQFWRANIDPSERYVLSISGSTTHRLKGSDCGYDNMVCAGDWTYTALNYGCVEAATMSGMEASRAICGFPKVIFGENYPKTP